VSGGFSPLPHAGHEISEADTHVESHDDVLSDAGSTPAASTIRLAFHLAFGEPKGSLMASHVQGECPERGSEATESKGHPETA